MSHPPTPPPGLSNHAPYSHASHPPSRSQSRPDPSVDCQPTPPPQYTQPPRSLPTHREPTSSPGAEGIWAPRPRIIPSNALKPFSGCQALCFEPITDGSQPLLDFRKQFATVFAMAGHPKETWILLVEMFLTGAASQTARAAMRANSAITWDGLMDVLQETHAPRDEQMQLRAAIALLRPQNFPSLSLFIAEFKRLQSFVDLVTCPAPLLADMLVTSLAGTQAGTASPRWKW